MYNYIIVSDDKEALKDKIEEIKKTLNKEFDLSNYDLEQDDIYDVLDEIQTFSMLGNPKFIVVASLEKIVNVSEAKINDLTNQMNDFNSDNYLIFTSIKNPDFRLQNLAIIRKYSTLIDVNTRNFSFDTYIKNYLNQNGYQINNDAIPVLISYVDNVSALKQALDLLICYKCEEKVIEINDILLMISKPLEEDLYNLTNKVLAGDRKGVFEIYNDLKIRKVAPTFIISMLINKFQELYNAYIIAEGTRGVNEAKKKIAQAFNIKENVAYYIANNTRNTNLKAILKNLKALDDLDYKIKSGNIDENIGLELYFLK